MERMEQVRDAAQVEIDRLQTVAGLEEIPDKEMTGLSGLETVNKDRLKILMEKVVNPYKADSSE